MPNVITPSSSLAKGFMLTFAVGFLFGALVTLRLFA